MKDAVNGLYKWYVEHVLRIEYPSELPKEGDKLGKVLFPGMLIFSLLTIVLFIGWILLSVGYYDININLIEYTLLTSAAISMLLGLFYSAHMKEWKWLIIGIILSLFLIYIILSSMYHL